MQRRALVGVLAILGIVAVGAGVAAVVFPALSGGPPSVSTVSDPNPDGEVGGLYSGTRTDPESSVRIGDGAGGLPILLWNDAATRRTLLVRLVHEESGETLVDRQVALPPDGTYLVRLLHPDRYTLTVGSEADERTRTLRVTEADFRCSDQRTTIRVRENGTVASRTQWEEVACD
ncbi:hypothetical protein BV210_03600 [Halorientalis sp. IM1011]|uniref:hypothetical protein n=1 Tax=Halorientalis sp. IM1011 TaxID=1932360 RepID=UPI00097CD72F|nr:hypothetical protein [Halorientalis sp. IM1011]AQL41856.1 hypothetical protein BV210_03600 [Halorientalis sp. IM1011]